MSKTSPFLIVVGILLFILGASLIVWGIVNYFNSTTNTTTGNSTNSSSSNSTSVGNSAGSNSTSPVSPVSPVGPAGVLSEKIGSRLFPAEKFSFVPKTCKQINASSFWDGLDKDGKSDKGGGCWVCPAGFNRTLESVITPRACSRSTGFLKPDEYKPATWQRYGIGPDGLEKSPDPQLNTLLYSDGYYQCPIGLKFALFPAKNCIKPETCSALFDDNTLEYNNDCYKCPNGYAFIDKNNAFPGCRKIT